MISKLLLLLTQMFIPLSNHIICGLILNKELNREMETSNPADKYFVLVKPLLPGAPCLYPLKTSE